MHLMRDSKSADSIQTAVGFGSAIQSGPLVPDIQDPSSQAREIKQALRDPKFARAVNKELLDQMLVGVIALVCFLILFFFLGYLLMH